ncbi:MAG TPA: transferase, partial [Streptosporangiaceae bacterium]|nr:transferase [Streptosporangiaceae bacterium]
LQRSARAHARGLREWLVAEHRSGRTVLAYGAASRAVALLREASVDRTLLPAVVDASPAKQGSRMPGTNIPIVSPARLLASRPDTVLLLVSDLLAEVRSAFPEVEASGARWVDSEKVVSHPAGG